MVDITSLKARLARLRLGSEFEDKHPELRDPASDDLEKKRGKKKAKKASKDKEKVRGSYNRTKRQEGSTQDYKKSGFGEYTKNTGDKRKKKNKLKRSDQKRNAALGSYKAYHKKQDLVADENKRNTKFQKKKKKKKVTRESDANVSLRERESPGVSQKTWDELDQYPEFMSDPTTD